MSLVSLPLWLTPKHGDSCQEVRHIGLMDQMRENRLEADNINRSAIIRITSDILRKGSIAVHPYNYCKNVEV